MKNAKTLARINPRREKAVKMIEFSRSQKHRDPVKSNNQQESHIKEDKKARKTNM